MEGAKLISGGVVSGGEKVTMRDETLETQQEIIELLESRDITVTTFEAEEFVRGDPTVEDRTVTGAEIEITAYISFDNEDEESRFRVK